MRRRVANRAAEQQLTRVARRSGDVQMLLAQARVPIEVIGREFVAEQPVGYAVALRSGLNRRTAAPAFPAAS